MEGYADPWAELYGPERMPGLTEVASHIGIPQWERFCGDLEHTYGVKPLVQYSACGAQPGWNVKYRKSGRALCTLYPMVGFFYAMISIGAKEEEAAALLMPACTAHTRKVYKSSTPSAMGRWLMLEVRDDTVMEDALKLVELRVQRR